MKAECALWNGRRLGTGGRSLHDASCFVATTRKIVDAMKLVAAIIWTAASAKPFASMLPVLKPKRPSASAARPITSAHTVRLVRIDFVSVITGPFWVEESGSAVDALASAK